MSKIDKSIEKRNASKLTVLIVILTSIFLNHSNKEYGINISLSDIFMLLSIILLVLNEKLTIPMKSTMFFLTLSISLIIISFFYTPLKFNININYIAILKDYIKLIACFLYLLLGYNIVKLNILDISLKYYSYMGLGIGCLGLLLNILNIDIFNNILYFGRMRFRGIMIDPNYYSVVQCTTLVYFLRNKDKSLLKKTIISLLNIIVVIMSGSKTGIITLISYFIYLLFCYLLNKNKFLKFWIIIFLILVIIVFSFSNILIQLNLILDKISIYIPIFDRVKEIFLNPVEAISKGGSSRGDTWISALKIIKENHLLGIGLGSYININKEMTNSSLLAHNTYLQITAEWGLIFSVIFFINIFILLFKRYKFIKFIDYDSTIFMLRDIIYILLIASFSISLNNARMFWMFLGALIYSIKYKNLIEQETY